MPVIENQRLVGMISEADLATHLSEHQISEFASAIHGATADESKANYAEAITEAARREPGEARCYEPGAPSAPAGPTPTTQPDDDVMLLTRLAQSRRGATRRPHAV